MSESDTRRVRGFYDDLAPTFELIYADWEASVARQGEALEQLLTSRLGQRQRHHVLDCSCGIGTQTFGLLQRGVGVVGADLSPDAVHRAQRTSVDRGLAAHFVAADMRRLPFRSAAFDAVMSADNSLPHLLNEVSLTSAFTEMARVTKLDGALLVSIRDYDEVLMTRPVSHPPSVSGEAGRRTITFQLWHWHDDGVHYEVELFQLAERAGGWAVSRWTMPSWAVSRSIVEDAAESSGWRDLRWIEPAYSGFFQPVLLATR